MPRSRELRAVPDLVQPEPLSAVGPLAAPATPATLGSRGLRIQAARRKTLYDNRPSVAGMRTMFSIDFFDTKTKDAVTPTQVTVVASIAETEVSIPMAETTGRMGHFTGSFVPTDAGEWKAVARHGGPTGEIVDVSHFYVLPSP